MPNSVWCMTALRYNKLIGNCFLRGAAGRYEGTIFTAALFPASRCARIPLPVTPRWGR